MRVSRGQGGLTQGLRLTSAPVGQAWAAAPALATKDPQLTQFEERPQSPTFSLAPHRRLPYRDASCESGQPDSLGYH